MESHSGAETPPWSIPFFLAYSVAHSSGLRRATNRLLKFQTFCHTLEPESELSSPSLENDGGAINQCDGHILSENVLRRQYLILKYHICRKSQPNQFCCNIPEFVRQPFVHSAQRSRSYFLLNEIFSAHLYNIRRGREVHTRLCSLLWCD